MNIPLNLKRPDVSHALIHLTRPANKKDAFEVLKNILTSGVLKASGKKGYIKGNGKAVCFSEMPLSSVPFFADNEESDKRYHPYGLALSKRFIFQEGGRPVIYLPNREADWIPLEEKWRHVRFEPNKDIDWTFEREWRVPGNIDLANSPGIYVLVWSATEARELSNLQFAIKNKIRGFLPMEHLKEFL